uniref:RNA methyltransferase n=1 Tax=Seriola dumerili TaxID=41447 RepID=A0A3B4TRW7_SERDU
MIRMSLDKETVLPHEAPLKTSPTFPATVSLSEQPQLRIGKRRYSMGVGFKGLAKRRRRANSDSQSEPVLPSHFLLGGNIFDPLNLNSLLDEEVNRTTNQETPQCSPLPSRGGDPVEILVPRDITDPLNLKGGAGDREGGGTVLLSPLKSRRRHRNRHHVPLLTREGSVSASPLPCELNTAITCRDDVAPPPILPRRHTHPLPGHAHKPGSQGDGRQRRRRRTTSTRCGGPQSGSSQPPEKKKDKHRYQYGNHSRYYGYHGFYGDGWEGRVGAEDDLRLRLLEADWFRDKRVLDVGCGAGHMTLSVARMFEPAHILGVELDRRLVHAAKQNIRHFLSHDLVVEERKRRTTVPSSSPIRKGEEEVKREEEEEFPNNITFVQGDYVSEREAWPGQGQYDVIMCLGVTKWVQLQAGDGGVVRLFKRAYQSLSPGGLFILEPQLWSSYSHSKRASETTYRNYRSVRMRPELFTSYLTDSVGFTCYRLHTHTGTYTHTHTHTHTQATSGPSTCFTKAPPRGSDVTGTGCDTFFSGGSAA